jgi:hypothetical protein
MKMKSEVFWYNKVILVVFNFYYFYFYQLFFYFDSLFIKIQKWNIFYETLYFLLVIFNKNKIIRNIYISCFISLYVINFAKNIKISLRWSNIFQWKICHQQSTFLIFISFFASISINETLIYSTKSFHSSKKTFIRSSKSYLIIKIKTSE